MSPLVYAIVPLWAIADRLFGIDKKEIKDGKSKGFATAILAALAFGWLTPGADVELSGIHLSPSQSGIAASMLMAIAWIATRSFPFRGIFGSATPRKDGQFFALVFRHALLPVSAAAASAIFLREVDPIRPAVIFGIWALCAGVLGLLHGEAKARAQDRRTGIQGWVNTAVELSRGGLFALAMILSH